MLFETNYPKSKLLLEWFWYSPRFKLGGWTELVNQCRATRGALMIRLFRFTIKIDNVKSENTAFYTLHYAKNLKIKRDLFRFCHCYCTEHKRAVYNCIYYSKTDLFQFNDLTKNPTGSQKWTVLKWKPNTFPSWNRTSEIPRTKFAIYGCD